MDHGQSIIIEIHFTTIVWEKDHLFSHNLILNPWVNTHKKRNKSTAAIITFRKSWIWEMKRQYNMNYLGYSFRKLPNTTISVFTWISSTPPFYASIIWEDLLYIPIYISLGICHVVNWHVLCAVKRFIKNKECI